MPLNELIASAARKGAEITGPIHRMCDDCAFKLGTDANNDENAVNAAMQMLISGGKFHCHRVEPNGDFVDAGRLCAGFQYAKAYYDKMEKELDEKDTADLLIK